MGVLNDVPAGSVSLDSVCTEELKRRPKRSPDYQAENQALCALAKGLTNSPEHVLQELSIARWCFVAVTLPGSACSSRAIPAT